MFLTSLTLTFIKQKNHSRNLIIYLLKNCLQKTFQKIVKALLIKYLLKNYFQPDKESTFIHQKVKGKRGSQHLTLLYSFLDPLPKWIRDRVSFDLVKKPDLVLIVKEYFQCNYLLSLALFCRNFLIKKIKNEWLKLILLGNNINRDNDIQK